MVEVIVGKIVDVNQLSTVTYVNTNDKRSSNYIEYKLNFVTTDGSEIEVYYGTAEERPLNKNKYVDVPVVLTGGFDMKDGKKIFKTHTIETKSV